MVKSDIGNLDLEIILPTVMTKKPKPKVMEMTVPNWIAYKQAWECAFSVVSICTRGRLYQIGAYKPKERCSFITGNVLPGTGCY